MDTRLAIVVVVVAVLAIARPLYLRRRRLLLTEKPSHPRVPARLLGEGSRTWIVFTTPYCAGCGPAIEAIRAAEPGAHVVEVDATVETGLARDFSIRSAPTVLLADGDGEVQSRLVGVAAVRQHALA